MSSSFQSIREAERGRLPILHDDRNPHQIRLYVEGHVLGTDGGADGRRGMDPDRELLVREA